jgi:hypothetical protein
VDHPQDFVAAGENGWTVTGKGQERTVQAQALVMGNRPLRVQCQEKHEAVVMGMALPPDPAQQPTVFGEER